MRIVSAATIVALAASLASAQRPASLPDSAGAPAEPQALALEMAPPAPVVFQDATIVTFRTSYAGFSAEKRARDAQRRLEALRPAHFAEPIEVRVVPGGRALFVGEHLAFGIFEGDLDPRNGRTIDEEAAQAEERLATALRERVRMWQPSSLVRSVLLSIVATAVFGVAIALLLRLRRFVLDVLSDETPNAPRLLRIGGLDLRGYVVGITSGLLRIATGIGIAVLAYFWLMFVFDKFPTTHAWAQESTNFLTDLGRNFAASFVAAVPGLVSAALVLLVGHFLARLSSDLFTDVEQEKIAIPGIHPETAGATRRLVNVLIWLLAGVMAYPFIPGSDTDIFKGVSVFVGILVTLGSAGIVGHLMSGLVLVYSRALRDGDYVRIGDVEGYVTEVGPLSTKLKNLKDEEFTIPNNVVVGNTTKNFTRLAREKGPTLSTSVTIGYDAPWRVVQDLLTSAAAKTPGLRKEPAPFVLQRGLSDFFVEYELVARLESASVRFLVLSQLHANIQDAFNERGLQIMVPHFEGQPERRVVVPKSHWSGEGIDSPDA